MSLRVWLPLTEAGPNNSLINKGLTDIGDHTASYNHDGTYVANGKIGNCYQTGSGKYFVLKKECMTDLTTEASVAFWIKILDWTANWSTFFQAGTNTNSWPGYVFGFLRNNNTSTIVFTIGDTSTTTTTACSTPALNLNQWYHIVLSYNSGTQRIYIDGSLATETTTTIIPKFSGITRITYGISNTYSGYPTNCQLNDVRIYDHCLSPKEVKILAQGLICHYPLNNNGQGNWNILTGTYYNSYVGGGGSGGTNENGKWHGGSGGNGSFSITEDSTCPIGHLSWNVLNNTTGNRDFQQHNQPYVNGQQYTASFYAKGNGTCLWRSWNNTDGKQMIGKTWTLTSDWKKYIYTFIASEEMETDSCSWHLGVTGAGSINICGMKLELGDKATPYCLAESETLNADIVYDTSGYCHNGSLIDDTLTTSSDTARYNISSHFNGATSGIIFNNLDLNPIFNNQCTVSFWIKSEDDGQRAIYFSAYSGTSWSIEKTASNRIRSYWNGSPDVEFSSGGNIISSEGWTHIALVRESSTSMKIYKNGVSTQTITTTTNTLNFATTWRMGRDYRQNDNTPFKGYMSDFRIYCTALSADDILELYNIGASIDNDGNLYATMIQES